VRRIPTGRSLGLGAVSAPGEGGGSVMELALVNLLASRSVDLRRQGEEALSAYLAEAPYAQEPWSGQRLPYDARGAGVASLAEHALLMQALTSANEARSEANSLLTSLAWRRDWYTWRLWFPNAIESRRAAALAALAGALCPEPERRLEAAMLQAGLAAQRGLNVLRRRAGESESEPELAEPMLALRRSLFFLEPRGGPDDPFVRSLLSDIRLFGEVAAVLERRGEETVMSWESDGSAGVVTFASGYPVTVAAGRNLAALSTSTAFGFTQVRYRPAAAGRCELLLELPDWAPPLPTVVPVYRGN
jgi:hypothetical protein